MQWQFICINLTNYTGCKWYFTSILLMQEIEILYVVSTQYLFKSVCSVLWIELCTFKILMLKS